jgi:hypothetical protein
LNGYNQAGGESQMMKKLFITGLVINLSILNTVVVKIMPPLLSIKLRSSYQLTWFKGFSKEKKG